MEWWLGEASASRAAVCVRASAPGDVVASSASETVTASADPAVRDGVVRLDLAVSGPTAVTLSEPGGGTAQATLRPAPQLGGRIAWGGCFNIKRSFPDQLLRSLDADAFVGLGDMPYAENTNDVFGVNTIACDGTPEAAIDPACYAAHQRQLRGNPGVLLFGRQRPMYFSPDDHDLALNNAEFSEQSFDSALEFPLDQPWDPAGIAQAQQIVAAGTSGLKWYYLGNPVNTDAGVDPDPFYFRFSVGQIEVFVLSCVAWGAGADRMRVAANGSMLGPLQKAWLLNSLAASDKPFKMILSPKQTLFASDVNPDSWLGNWGTDGAYSAEFREIADAIHAADGWAVPGGVAWGSSDWHSPGVFASLAGQDGATADHVCINSTIGMDAHGVRSSGPYSPYTVWAIDEMLGVQGTRYWGVGFAEVNGTELVLSYVTKTGQVMWSGVIAAGENRIHTQEDV